MSLLFPALPAVMADSGIFNRPVSIYLSGPMTGYVRHNYPAFEGATAVLRSYGHDVYTPHEFGGGGWGDRQSEDFPLVDAFVEYTRAIGACDVVMLLPGWDRSKGVCAELALARVFGKPAFFMVAWNALVECGALCGPFLRHVTVKPGEAGNAPE